MWKSCLMAWEGLRYDSRIWFGVAILSFGILGAVHWVWMGVSFGLFVFIEMVGESIRNVYISIQICQPPRS